MKGNETRLVEFMDGSKKRFVIPVYQRNYDWKQENCKQLFDDLVKVEKGRRRTHFFGSIVSVYQPSGRTTEFLVVDGQQRLTTVSLLLLAIYNLLKAGKLNSADSNLAQRIYEEYLVDKFQPEETRIKLKPVQNDREAFSKLFGEEAERIVDSHITKNYDYFVQRILANEIAVDEIVEAIEKLQIINIELSGDDNPQLIFESINSTGVDLTEGDKIRNYVLMDLSASVQERYFTTYWKPIEQLVRRPEGGDGVGLFVRDFLSAEQGEIPNLNRVYPEFKLFAEQYADREELLKKILSAARCYQMLLDPSKIEDATLANVMANINRQECTPSYPFVLRVFKMYAECVLPVEQVRRILRMIDAYVLRRLICDLPTNSLNKVFVELHRGVSAHDANVPYDERVAYVLMTRSGKARFPDDAEFVQALVEKRVYEMRTKNRAYFFSRLENGTSRTAVVNGVEDVVYDKIRNGDYTVEHVMPQKLTEEWRTVLGGDWARVHETWLHRLGNLTLTAYNSEMSNKSFVSKAGRSLADLKADAFGFSSEAHHLFLNEFIAQQETWTEAEITKRAKDLADRAQCIWQYPTTTYNPPRPEVFAYGIVAHRPGFFTNSKPVAFRFRDVEYRTDSWTTIVRQVLTLLAKESTEKLHAAAAKSSTIRLSIHKTDTLVMEEFAPDTFACCHGSVWEKCNVMKQALSEFPDLDVEVVFNNPIEDEEDE